MYTYIHIKIIEAGAHNYDSTHSYNWSYSYLKLPSS